MRSTWTGTGTCNLWSFVFKTKLLLQTLILHNPLPCSGILFWTLSLEDYHMNFHFKSNYCLTYVFLFYTIENRRYRPWKPETSHPKLTHILRYSLVERLFPKQERHSFPFNLISKEPLFLHMLHVQKPSSTNPWRTKCWSAADGLQERWESWVPNKKSRMGSHCPQLTDSCENSPWSHGAITLS